MDINDLTFGQLKEIASMFRHIEPTNSINSNNLNNFAIGKHVIIRTYSAGVFFGVLKERSGKEAVVCDCRRIWSWTGAFTLSSVAINGVKTAKLSLPEPEKLVTECIEVIPCSDFSICQLTEMTSHE